MAAVMTKFEGIKPPSLLVSRSVSMLLVTSARRLKEPPDAGTYDEREEQKLSGITVAYVCLGVRTRGLMIVGAKGNVLELWALSLNCPPCVMC